MSNVVKFYLGEDNNNDAVIVFDKKKELLTLTLNNIENEDSDVCELQTEFTLSKGIDNIKVAVSDLLQNKYVIDSRCEENYHVIYTFKDSNLTLDFRITDAEWCDSDEEDDDWDDAEENVGLFDLIIKNDYFEVYASLQCYPANPIAEFKEFLLKVKKSL